MSDEEEIVYNYDKIQKWLQCSINTHCEPAINSAIKKHKADPDQALSKRKMMRMMFDSLKKRCASQLWDEDSDLEEADEFTSTPSTPSSSLKRTNSKELTNPINKKQKSSYIVFLDLETTDLLPKGKIIEICLISYDTVTGDQSVFSKLVHPQGDIKMNVQAQAKHHIKPSDLMNKPGLKEVWPTVIDILTHCEYIMGYSIDSFDIPMLQNEAIRLQLNPLPKINSIDLRDVVKTKCNLIGVTSYTLENVYKAIIGKPLLDAHRAQPDCEACIAIYHNLHYKGYLK